MNKLKYVKLENEDGSYSSSIPLAVDSDYVDVNGETLTNKLNNKAEKSQINNLQSQISSLASGSPLVASNISGMTDTTRVYVNTTDGNWYYYNGSAWVSGGVYQSTGIDENNQVILNIKYRELMNMDNFHININKSYTTPFELKQGDKIKIKVTGGSGFSINLFVEGHSSETTLINQIKEYEYTVPYDGKLRFYFIATNATFEADIHLESYVRNNVNKLVTKSYEYIPETPDFNAVKIKSNIVHDSLLFTSGYYTITGNSIEDTLTHNDSSAYYSSNIIRVRNNDGFECYLNLRLNNPDGVASESARVCICYDIYGKYLRAYTASQFISAGNRIPDNVYYMILQEAPNHATLKYSYWICDMPTLKFLAEKEIYYVGPDKQFTTFTQMLIALKDNKNEKIVYIDGGEYDIFNEMGGADYMATIVDTVASLNWRDVCHLVPDNTHIIGLGTVKLTWNATAEQMQSNQVARLFSPLNISGSCTIENIIVEGTNCRYIVHDETSGLSQYDKTKHHFINCTFRKTPMTYGYSYVYGAGHGRECTYIFDNCTFETINNGAVTWSMHDWSTTEYKSTNITFNNCIFINSLANNKIRFSSSDIVGRHDKVIFNGCYFSSNPKILFGKENGTNINQCYQVTLNHCNSVTSEYEDGIINTEEPLQYNVIYPQN